MWLEFCMNEPCERPQVIPSSAKLDIFKKVQLTIKFSKVILNMEIKVTKT